MSRHWIGHYFFFGWRGGWGFWKDTTLLTAIFRYPFGVGTNTLYTKMSSVHLIALLFSGIHRTGWTILRITWTIFLASSRTVFATTLGQRVITFSLTFLHPTATGQTAGTPRTPGSPATIDRLWQVTFARHTFTLHAPVVAIFTRCTIGPWQLARIAVGPIGRDLTPQTFAIGFLVTIDRLIAVYELTLLI